MLQLSLSLNGSVSRQDDGALLKEKGEAIVRCRRKIEAARFLYEDGDLTRDEYLRRKEQNEAEIAHWEARTSDTEQAAQELMLCVEALDKITKLWAYADSEDRQGLARSLFESITYDLDKRRITDFRLKPWADKYLVLRDALYDMEGADTGNGGEGGATPNMGEQDGNEKATHMNANGLESQTGPITAPFLRIGAISAPIEIPGHETLHDFNPLLRATTRFVARIYHAPLQITKKELLEARNVHIRYEYQKGATITELSQHYALSPQRIFQIVNNRHH